MNALEQALLERLKASEAKSVSFLQALLRAPSPNPPGDTRPAAALVLGAPSPRARTCPTSSPASMEPTPAGTWC